MAAHFSSDTPQTDEIKKPDNNILNNGDDTYLSIYDNISISTDDTHSGSFYENNPQKDNKNDIIVVDVEPYDDGSIAKEAALDDLKLAQLKQAQEAQTLYQTIADGTNPHFDTEDDLSDMFEHLYEETLPEDVFEIEANKKNKKIQNLAVIPSHKPAYFGKTPMIAIVIDDMGINRKRTADISSLKYPLTSSFLTYSNKMDEQIDLAINSNHEIMLHAPMEALGQVDNAPDVLTTAMSINETKNNLQIMLSKVKNIKGINNHMGSKLTQDKEHMQAVMEVLKDRGLFFLDSKTSPQSVADETAKEIGVKHAARNVFLDNNNDKEYILKQLALTERLALKNGYAIAIGHPKSQTFLALSEWLPTLQQKGLKLVHLSQIIDILNQ